jgi:hypothetical protein
MSDENEILLTRIQCELSEYCGALAFKAEEKDELFISGVHIPNFFVPKYLKRREEKEEMGGD